MTAVLRPEVLRPLSYAHSLVYCGLLYVAIAGHDRATTILGWSHGLMWIAMALLCLAAVRLGRIPIWLGVMVAVVGGVGPFAGSIGFAMLERRGRAPAGSSAA